MNPTTTIDLFGNSFKVSFPNVGQMIDIETAKVLLSNNTYDQLVRSRVKTASLALDLIDAIANFSVLIPGFQNLVGVKENTEIEYVQVTQLVTAYRNQFFPWYENIMRDIDASVKEAKKKLDTIVADSAAEESPK